MITINSDIGKMIMIYGIVLSTVASMATDRSDGLDDSRVIGIFISTSSMR